MLVKLHQISYEIVEHLAHEMDQNGVVVPLSHKFFKQSCSSLQGDLWHHCFLYVILQSLVVVVIEVLRLVELVAEREYHSDRSKREILRVALNVILVVGVEFICV